MITPIWEPSDVTLAEPLTLTLLESLDLGGLLSQFDNLPHTLLLFMKKLGKIIIDEDVQEEEGAQGDEDKQKDGDEQEDEDEQEDGDEQEGEAEQETEPNTRVKSITTFVL
jgi:TATA-binding protein-associated factor Taf7